MSRPLYFAEQIERFCLTRVYDFIRLDKAMPGNYGLQEADGMSLPIMGFVKDSPITFQLWRNLCEALDAPLPEDFGSLNTLSLLTGYLTEYAAISWEDFLDRHTDEEERDHLDELVATSEYEQAEIHDNFWEMIAEHLLQHAALRLTETWVFDIPGQKLTNEWEAYVDSLPASRFTLRELISSLLRMLDSLPMYKPDYPPEKVYKPIFRPAKPMMIVARRGC